MIAARPRGKPLVGLALVLLFWIGARAALWESPLAPLPSPAAVPRLAEREIPFPRPASRFAPVEQPRGLTAPTVLRPASAATSLPVWARPQTGAFAREVFPAAYDRPLPEAGPVPPVNPRIAGGHSLLWLAAVSQLPMPAEASSNALAHRPAAPGPALRRWSGDAWFLWRRGGTGFNLPGAGLPGANLPSGTYGASQYGAVIRYRLGLNSPHRPALYLRGTGSIDRPRYEEVAAGLSARPLAGVPVAAMAELRATRSFGRTDLRPAVALVSELPPVSLPLGLQGEAYAQAGYVGGRGGTAFLDGQVRIDRKVIDVGGFELRAGGGAWGGAQEGAKRVDIGPSASLRFSTGAASARLSADWRFRVAGRAAPESGPALTLSAGF